MDRRMAHGCANWSNWILFFYLFFLMQCDLGNGIRQITSHDQENEHHQKGKDLKEDNIEASKIGFFTMKELYIGKKMPINFPNKEPSSLPDFLPREEADSIPFSLNQLSNLLQLFSLSHASPQAKSMEETLTHCEAKPINGETKSCATSLESMLDFIRGIFGLETNFTVLTTTHTTKSPLKTTLLQNYTVLEVPKEVPASKMAACHLMYFPFAVFYCHGQQESENKVLKVSLGGENGERVEAVAVSHMDTSGWNPDHISFRLLCIRPGSSPVCHFFSANNLLWVPFPTTN